MHLITSPNGMPLAPDPVALSVPMQLVVGTTLAVGLLAVALLFRRAAVWGITAVSFSWWVTYGLPFGLRLLHAPFVLPAELLLGAGGGSIPLVRWSMDVFRDPAAPAPPRRLLLLLFVAWTLVGWLVAHAPWRGDFAMATALDNTQRALLAVVLIGGSLYAWLRHRDGGPVAGGAALLLAAMLLFGMRILIVTLLRDATGELRWPETRTATTTLQVLQTGATGVLLLIPALLSERTALTREQARVRVAERAVADAARLDSLGRLAGGVAHDFNNVLAAVLSSAEMAREYRHDADALDEELRAIVGSAEHGRALTRRLLSFARRDHSRGDRVNVPSVANDVVAMLRRLMDARFTITLACEAVGEERLTADAAQLEQILLNLVLNARDAMPNGGRVRIRVALSAAPSAVHGARQLLISVADDGTGIPPDVLPHIFELLYTTKSDGQGTGLGLATVDTIVRQAGGTIDVHTEVGRGTRFEVSLPLLT